MDGPQYCNTASPRRRRVYATEQDWQRIRAEFTRLYYDEGKTLVEVAKNLEINHEFYAS
jgi:DNA-binding transcriptional regulator LsrR (DeoR family)